MAIEVTWHKLQILKNQDGGQSLFWKLSNHHNVNEKSLDFDVFDIQQQGRVQQLTGRIGRTIGISSRTKWRRLPAGDTLPASNRYHFVLLDKDESCPTADLSNICCPSGLFDLWAVERAPDLRVDYRDVTKYDFLKFKMAVQLDFVLFLSRLCTLTHDIDIANLSVCPSICL